MHLQMMKRQPRDIASVHCHSPHATAFAIAGVVPPTCLLPEYEVFCTVALAPYRTPGTPELGRLIADLVDTHDTILMANHGVVTWSHNNVEEAYWRLEVIESYCRTLLAAGQLGKPLNTLSPAHIQELLQIKRSLGFVDPRYDLEAGDPRGADPCGADALRPGVARA
jgi:L-fuculose-phosphate aldolase